MDDRNLPTSGVSGEQTQTIDLNRLFTEDVTSSGSFDIRSDIWATTFGRLIQALPCPALLIDHSLKVIVANEACGKISREFKRILNTPFSELFPDSDSVKKAQSLVAEVFSTRKSQRTETAVRIGKNEKWVRMTFRSIRIMQERYILLLIEDLTADKKQLLLQQKHNEQLRREIAERKRAEDATHASELRYRRLFESARDGILILDFDTGQILDVNPYLMDMLGYSHEEFMGKCIWEVSPFKDTALNKEAFAKLQKEGYIRYENLPLESRDGRSVDAEFVSNSYSVNDKTFIQCNIRRSDQIWGQIFNALSDLVMIVDHQHKILRVNRAMADAIGITEDEAIGQSCFELVHGQKERPDFCPHAQLLADGKEHSEEIFEPRLGGIYDVRVFPLLVQDGQRPRSVHVARDITEKKRTEVKIQQQSEFLHNIMNSLTHHFYVVDANDYTIMVANRSAELAGITVGQKCYTATHGITRPCSGPDHFCPLMEVKKTGKPATREHIHYDDGIRRNVEIHAYPIKSAEGDVVQVIEYVLDITARRKAEEAAKETEKRYRRLFEEAPLMYVITRNEQGVPFISDCNERFLLSLSYKREEVIGHPLADFYSPESRSEMLEGGGYSRTLAGEFFIGERELLARDGRPIPTLVFTATELDPAGRVIGSRAMYVDVTEKKRAEEALRESEEKYRLLADNTLDVIWQTDLDLRFTYVNPAIFRLTGHTPDEVIGSRVSEHCDEENFTKIAQTAWEEISRGPDSSGAIFYTEILNKDKEPVSVEIHGKIVLDQNGLPTALQGVARDITKRKQSEEARLANERKYRNLFDESRDGVFFVLRDGEIMDANPSFLELFGYTREEMIVKNLRELYVDPADRPIFQEEIENKGFVKDYEIRFRKKDRTAVDCLLTASVQFRDDGSIMGYRGIIRDLTIRKRLQNQLFQAQKMESIGTLAGGIAHDFNNLLQIVLGTSDLLIRRKGKESPDLKNLEAIRKAAKDGKDLVKGLLSFSRKAPNEIRPVDLNQLVNQTYVNLKRMIPRMIEIKIILDDDLSRVNADPIQIGQVLINLAVNAQHAMPEGGKLTIETRNVTLDTGYCRTHVEAKPGEYCMLKISDTGYGMEEDIKARVFDPFFTTKEVGVGTGLGLSIVYGIVKSYDGHITCSSEPSHGTTFSIYLPALPGESNLDMATTVGEMPAFGTETILLVDDEEPIRNALEQILTPRGYKVFRAENGNEALEIYRKKKSEIDLVVLDLNMPGMDGKEVLDAILKIDPKASVLIASGYAVSEQTKRFLNIQARGFIGKPFDSRDLLQAVRRVLDETGSPKSRIGGSGPVFVGSAEYERTPALAPPLVEASPVDKGSDIEVLLGRFRILAIDDRAPYLTMLEAGLRQFGHTPLTASSGIEGLQVFQETPVDLVICDLEMPELDGWGVGKRIKEICQEKEIPKTPFILLTGQADMEDIDREARENMADCGVDAIVTKPVDIPDLLEVIKGLI